MFQEGRDWMPSTQQAGQRTICFESLNPKAQFRFESMFCVGFRVHKMLASGFEVQGFESRVCHANRWAHVGQVQLQLPFGVP